MNGGVRSENAVSVYPNMAGKISSVPVVLGGTVKKGQLIAEIDPSTPGTAYRANPVYAPISGVITSLPLPLGSYVTQSTPLGKIGDIKSLQILSHVPERHVNVLKPGLKAHVTLEAYPNESFDAHIQRVSPIVDEVSRSKEVYYVFDSLDERINIGMYVKIRLDTVLHENVLNVPVDSVLVTDHGSFLYTIAADDTIKEKEVHTGVTIDGIVEILDGIQEGEKIVSSGIRTVADGAKIRVVSSDNPGETL
ncbi:MAG: efflux RND transporter periplasmic adaptor subunit [Treponema sp.]|nr:efflux RND transporter periplasmic adaptor subunit [Treponema sp.]